jgi:hypothetical protein
MSDSSNSNFGFGKFVPGFDFLQNLANSAVKGASSSMPQLPNLANWVAPTINVEELEKRIDELKAVQFWLDQNAMALKATIQALEVQKMTLATLKGMNFNLGDVANAFKIKAADTVMGGMQKVSETAAGAAGTASEAASSAADAAADAAAARPAARKRAAPKEEDQPAAAEGVVDPLQWWGSLTQQFQQIAATAMKDAAKQTAFDTTRNMAADLAKEAIKTATGMASSVTQTAAKTAASVARPAKAAGKKSPARKAARKSAG